MDLDQARRLADKVEWRIGPDAAKTIRSLVDEVEKLREDIAEQKAHDQDMAWEWDLND